MDANKRNQGQQQQGQGSQQGEQNANRKPGDREQAGQHQDRSTADDSTTVRSVKRRILIS